MPDFERHTNEELAAFRDKCLVQLLITVAIQSAGYVLPEQVSMRQPALPVGTSSPGGLLCSEGNKGMIEIFRLPLAKNWGRTPGPFLKAD